MSIHIELFGFELHLSLTRPSAPVEFPSLEATSGGQFERSEQLWSGTEEFGFSGVHP